MQLPEFFLATKYTALSPEWSAIKVTGSDREKFFQGQITQDVMSIELGSSKLSSRVNRTGLLQYYFYLARHESHLQILVPANLKDLLLSDLNKFIIMDEVVLVDESQKSAWHFFADSRLKFKSDFFKGTYLGLDGVFSTEKISVAEFSQAELELLKGLSLFPDDRTSHLGKLINETSLNAYSVSYSKGCYLGQETVAKIENNRGAAFLPVILKMQNEFKGVFQIDGKKAGEIFYTFNWLGNIYAVASLFRDFRVVGKKLNFENTNAEVMASPMLNFESKKDRAYFLKDLSQVFFLKDKSEEALALLSKVIELDPFDVEALEMLGALYGRLGQFEKAIELMNKLESIDPTSVMAHTNKSLFLMKLGKITEAEEEKSKATVKSFAKNADVAKAKKLEVEMSEKKLQDLKKREAMFFKVLEIDEEDTVANQGLGSVYYEFGRFEEALKCLERALAIDEKLSVSYLLAGKCFEALGKIHHARKVYEAGIQIASKKGDMMPANEMQSRLNQLS